eukprot:g55660.t1
MAGAAVCSPRLPSLAWHRAGASVPLSNRERLGARPALNLRPFSPCVWERVKHEAEEAMGASVKFVFIPKNLGAVEVLTTTRCLCGRGESGPAAGPGLWGAKGRARGTMAVVLVDAVGSNCCPSRYRAFHQGEGGDPYRGTE